MGHGRQGKPEKVIPDASIKNGIIQKNLIFKESQQLLGFSIIYRRRKGMKRRIAVLFLSSIFLFTSCTLKETERGKLIKEEKETEKPVELKLFYSGENTNWIAAIEELGENFMSLYPNITLQMEYSSTDRYTEELKAKEATEEFPDIFEIDNPYMFAEAGKLGEIDERFGELVENPVIIHGKIYALPYYSTCYGIVYNQVIFKRYGLEVPETYEEFLKICEILKANQIAPLAIGGNENSVENGWINYFFLTQVQKQNSNWQEKRYKGEVSFKDPDMEHALLEFQNLMTGDFVLEDSIHMGDNEIISRMINQEVAMYYGTPAMLAKILEAYPRAVDSDKTPLGKEIKNDTVQIRLGWFYMPDAQGENVVIEKAGAQWAVSEACMEQEEKKKAAETFFNFCYDREHYRKVLQAMYAIPVTKGAVLYAAPMVQQGVLTDYRYASRNTAFLGNTETPEGFCEDMEAILDSVAAKTMSVKTAAKFLEESWEKAEEGQKP